MRARSLFAGALLGFACLLAPRGARADIAITQQVEGAGGQGEMAIKIQGDHLRADVSAQVTMLLDLKSGDTIFLQNEPKTYSKLSAAESAAMVKKFQEAIPPGAGKLETTTQKRVIAGYNTQLFIWTIGEMKLRFWVARDVPNGQWLEDLLDRVQATGPFASVSALLPPASALPGLRLRTEMEVGPQKVTYTITGWSQDPLDAKLFELPKDYKEAPFAIEPPKEP